MPDLHPQDWLIIVEAVEFWIRQSDEYPKPPRRQRASEIVEEVLEERGLDGRTILQVDDGWNGASSQEWCG